ncbi:hypothetical protein [Burkholderia sp. A1]|uniref:hypothetical protein n=1 Tax=Burkholderia sp. A1 TaxID=148446 RepID=UPI00126984A2|nr:hypothetical protein [Burkholderia sp. A1]
MEEKYPDVDAYLFGRGISIESYFVQGDVIGYVSNGRAFDLHIEDGAFHLACLSRLIERGAKVLPAS